MPQEAEQVADLLHSAALHLLRRAAEQDGAGGLSPARLSALSVVVNRGPVTIGELASAERVRSATMTGIVNGLEDEGFVRRQPHGRDRRAVLVEATAAGRRAYTRAHGRRIGLVAGLFDDLTEAELDLLRRAAELIEVRSSPRPWQPLHRRTGSR